MSIKDDVGYEAVAGIIDRRIAARADWKETDVLGPDEISLRKGHKDFVRAVTAIIGGKTVILALLRDRKKGNGEKTSENNSEKAEKNSRKCVFQHVRRFCYRCKINWNFSIPGRVS